MSDKESLGVCVGMDKTGITFDLQHFSPCCLESHEQTSESFVENQKKLGLGHRWSFQPTARRFGVLKDAVLYTEM